MLNQEICNFEIIPDEKSMECFKKFFLDRVHIIHYQVPKDIDLNHYFEIMNSRGEQLEKHEIIKARLMSVLQDLDDKSKFNAISNMSILSHPILLYSKCNTCDF